MQSTALSLPIAPYTDKAGKGMSQGAAEQLLASSGRYIGPGGGTAFRDGDVYLYAFHYYDGQANGASKLQIRPISFSLGGPSTSAREATYGQAPRA